MPDTAQEVRTILSRTLRELDEAIENPSASLVLSALRSLLGVDDGDGTAAPAAQASSQERFWRLAPQPVCAWRPRRKRRAQVRSPSDAGQTQRCRD